MQSNEVWLIIFKAKGVILDMQGVFEDFDKVYDLVILKKLKDNELDKEKIELIMDKTK